MTTASPLHALQSRRPWRPPAALPERFNELESMLFAPRPADARTAAERYAGELLSRPVPPPRVAPPLPEPGWTTAIDP